MLQDNKTFSSFSVNDLQQARDFYQDTLGIKVVEQEYMMQIHTSGGSYVLAYVKPDHTPAAFTVLNFEVENIEKIVAGLKAKGVAFESYDLENLKTDEDDISRSHGMKIAWFRDPAGNILSLIES